MKTNNTQFSFRKVVVIILASIALTASLYGQPGCFEVRKGKITPVKCYCRCNTHKRDSRGKCL